MKQVAHGAHHNIHNCWPTLKHLHREKGDMITVKLIHQLVCQNRKHTAVFGASERDTPTVVYLEPFWQNPQVVKSFSPLDRGRVIFPDLLEITILNPLPMGLQPKAQINIQPTTR